jgi:hypothetical protein
MSIIAEFNEVGFLFWQDANRLRQVRRKKSTLKFEDLEKESVQGLYIVIPYEPALNKYTINSKNEMANAL